MAASWRSISAIRKLARHTIRTLRRSPGPVALRECGLIDANIVADLNPGGAGV
jgi:hypothetical protein